jgi:allantoinase
LLVEEGGFLYNSDAHNDELPYWVCGGGRAHLVVPYTLTNNDGQFVRGNVATGREFFRFLRAGVDLLRARPASAPRRSASPPRRPPSRAPRRSSSPRRRKSSRS